MERLINSLVYGLGGTAVGGLVGAVLASATVDGRPAQFVGFGVTALGATWLGSVGWRRPVGDPVASPAPERRVRRGHLGASCDR